MIHYLAEDGANKFVAGPGVLAAVGGVLVNPVQSMARIIAVPCKIAVSADLERSVEGGFAALEAQPTPSRRIEYEAKCVTPRILHSSPLLHLTCTMIESIERDPLLKRQGHNYSYAVQRKALQAFRALAWLNETRHETQTRIERMHERYFVPFTEVKDIMRL